MNILRRIVIGLGSLVIVALVLTLAAPKTVHAVVSTLVTVSNTSSNPVPTLAAEAARSFTATENCSLFTGVCSPTIAYTVPSGETAVIESISDRCHLVAGTVLVELSVGYDDTLGQTTFTNLQVGPTTFISGLDVVSNVQNLKAYAGPGAITMEQVASAPQSSGTFCEYTLSGYLVP